MNQLIQSINDGILATDMVKNLHYKALGLAESIVVRKNGTDTTMSAIIGSNGDAAPTFIDNLSDDLIIYHKLNSKSYTSSSQTGYGDNKRLDTICDMSIYLCGKRQILDQYALEGEAVKAIVAAGAAPMQSSFLKKDLWNAEWSGYSMPLPLDLFLFRINYRASAVKLC